MASVDLATIVARSAEVIFTEVNGDVTMMSVQNGKYYSLPSVGAHIWRILDEPASVAEICDRLMTQYRVDGDRCKLEVLTFVRQLADQGIVCVTDGAG